MHNTQYMNTEQRTGIHDNALLLAEKIISIRGSQSETKMRCGGRRHCQPQFKVPGRHVSTQCLTHSEWRLQYSEKASPTCEVGHLIFNGCCLTLQEMCQNNWSLSSLTILRIFSDKQNTHRVCFLDRFQFQVKANSLNAEIFNMTCMSGSWSHIYLGVQILHSA